eukprot:34950-Chlamydomonas_euryale.AAC.2
MSHASEWIAASPIQSFRCIPSRAKLIPTAGSGTSAGTSCGCGRPSAEGHDWAMRGVGGGWWAGGTGTGGWANRPGAPAVGGPSIERRRWGGLAQCAGGGWAQRSVPAVGGPSKKRCAGWASSGVQAGSTWLQALDGRAVVCRQAAPGCAGWASSGVQAGSTWLQALGADAECNTANHKGWMETAVLLLRKA